LKTLPLIFREAHHEYQQSWRSKHVAIYTRDEVAGTSHSYFVWSVTPVSGAEERGELLGNSQSLDQAVTIASKFEWESAKS